MVQVFLLNRYVYICIYMYIYIYMFIYIYICIYKCINELCLQYNHHFVLLRTFTELRCSWLLTGGR